MHRRSRLGVIFAAQLLACTWCFPAEETPVLGRRTLGPFQVDTLAEGVFLFRPSGTAPTHANSLVVVREDGLLVVDAQPTAPAARDLLAAIAQVSSKPVRYLAYTHPHADAVGGAAAFPASALRIGSAGCRDALADPLYDFGAEARARAASAPEWQEPERAGPILIPTCLTTLEDPKNAVVLLPAPPDGRSHSRGDLLVQIPRAGIVAVGDVAFPSRNPFSEDADLGGWLNALNNLSAMAPKIVVPSRGPALDPKEIRIERDALAWLRGQVQAAFVDRVAPGQMPDRILASPDVSKYFDLSASPSFLRPLIERAVQEALEDRRKRGLD